MSGIARFLLVSFGLGSTLASQSAVSLVESGDVIAGIGTVERIENLTVNDHGDWMAEIKTDLANHDLDSVVLRNGRVLLQEGEPVLEPEGAWLGRFAFGTRMTLTSRGESAWVHPLGGTNGLEDAGAIFFGDGLLVQKGAVASAPQYPAGSTYLSLGTIKLNERRDVLYVGSLRRPDQSIFTAAGLLRVDADGELVSETALLQAGDILPGQTSPISRLWSDPERFAMNDLGDLVFQAELNGTSGLSSVVYLNDTLLAQTGTPSPVAGRNWSTLAAARVGVNNHGDTMYTGVLDGDPATNVLIVKNGVKFRQKGDTLPDIAPDRFLDFGEALFEIADNGDVLWYGAWDAFDPEKDTGLFLNDDLIVQEGATSVEGTVVDDLNRFEDGYAISPNGRYVIFEADLEGDLNGAYLLDRGPLPSTSPRNGSDVNPRAFRSTTPPQLGATWVAEIDVPQGGGSALTLLVGYEAAVEPVLLPIGELLVDLTTTPLVTNVSASWGGAAKHHIPLPADPTLAGFVVHTQGVVLGGGVQLCNAIDVWLGL